MMITAKMSGVSASTPGACSVMCARENSPMGLPISSSKVALQALATLDVPVTKQTWRREEGVMSRACGTELHGRGVRGGRPRTPQLRGGRPVWDVARLPGPEKRAFPQNPGCTRAFHTRG